MEEPKKKVEDEVACRPKIPDGGWGWMVVFASVVISAVADGVSFSFGLLYIEFLNEFGVSKSTTSLIGSLFLAVPLLTGTIMSALVDRFGCRLMTIAGGLISCLGFLLSSYAKSITTMYLTFGVLSGLGLGLCYVTAVVSIAFWFDKRRTLAVSIGACGTGIGTFIYAPMTQYLIQEYGWRGTALFLAGGFLNMCVCGALMRDPDWVIEQNRQNSGGKLSKSSSVSRKSDLTDLLNIEELREYLKSGKDAQYILQSLATTMDNANNKNLQNERVQSVVNLPTFVKEKETVPLEVLQLLSSNKKMYNVILENYPSLPSCRSTSDKALNIITEEDSEKPTVTFCMTLKRSDTTRQESVPEEPSLSDPLINHTAKLPPQTWFKTPFSGNQHYLRNIRFHRGSAMHRGAMLNTHKYRLRASSCPDIYRNSMITLAKEDDEDWYDEFVELLKSMVDFSLFKELHFFLMSLSTVILFAWCIIPYFYLAEHLIRSGYPEDDASFIISTIGVTNTVGMILLGWAGDHSWMNITKTYSICLILCGLCVIAMMAFTAYYYMVVVSSALFGLFFASNLSFTPGILVQLVPLERFTTAYGLILLCQGIGHLGGPPLGGLLFDITSSWEQCFWQAGIWIIIAGILMAIVPYTKNRKIIGKGPVEKELASEKESIV